MIEIKITQTCDGCGECRDLNSTNRDSVTVQGQVGGWREVQTNKWLCPKCIAKALNKEKTS